MELPAFIAAEQMIARQAMTLSLVRQAAEMDRAIAAILEQAMQSVPVSSVRGSSVDLSA